MVSKLDKLNSMIGKKKNLDDVNIGFMLSEFGCVDALVGVEYEVYDAHGNLTGRIKRKALYPEQIGELMRALEAVVRTKNKKR